MKLYLEVSPEVDFDLDDIVLEVNIHHHRHYQLIIITVFIITIMMIEAVDAGDWESEANERIDRLRKRDVTIEVRSMRMVVMVIIVRMVMVVVIMMMMVALISYSVGYLGDHRGN